MLLQATVATLNLCIDGLYSFKMNGELAVIWKETVHDLVAVCAVACLKGKLKNKCALKEAMKAHRKCRGIVLFFL